MNRIIQPNWPSPTRIRAFCTTRLGGVSKAPFDSFNLATSTEDDITNVQKNRALLQQILQLPSEPVWIKQTHSVIAVPADSVARGVNADASFTDKPNVVCAVMTADCLPVLVCDQNASWVAAIHAGWRGLATGVIERTIEKIPVARENLLIWLGPAIGPSAFEVGADVFDLFAQHDEKACLAFKPIANNKWLGDMYALARQRLDDCGIKADAIYGGDLCTYTDKERFYSYRRDGKTGRMVSLIWIEG